MNACVGFTSCSPPPSASNFHFHSPPMSQFHPSHPRQMPGAFFSFLLDFASTNGVVPFCRALRFCFCFWGVVWPMPASTARFPVAGTGTRVDVALKDLLPPTSPANFWQTCLRWLLSVEMEGGRRKYRVGRFLRGERGVDSYQALPLVTSHARHF